jgi:hypothetical protein
MNFGGSRGVGGYATPATMDLDEYNAKYNAQTNALLKKILADDAWPARLASPGDVRRASPAGANPGGVLTGRPGSRSPPLTNPSGSPLGGAPSLPPSCRLTLLS